MTESVKIKSWESIDTAPIDGIAVLLWPYQYSNVWQGKANKEVVLGYFDDCREEWFNPEAKDWFEPTHWMPLPTPPE
jgi:hypothetical protein